MYEYCKEKKKEKIIVEKESKNFVQRINNNILREKHIYNQLYVIIKKHLNILNSSKKFM